MCVLACPVVIFVCFLLTSPGCKNVRNLFNSPLFPHMPGSLEQSAPGKAEATVWGRSSRCPWLTQGSLRYMCPWRVLSCLHVVSVTPAKISHRSSVTVADESRGFSLLVFAERACYVIYIATPLSCRAVWSVATLEASFICAYYGRMFAPV